MLKDKLIRIFEGASLNFFGYLLGFNLIILFMNHTFLMILAVVVLDLIAIFDLHNRKFDKQTKVISDEKLQTKRYKRF